MQTSKRSLFVKPIRAENHPSAILFFDGECAFCSSTVQFVYSRMTNRYNLMFAPLSGETSRVYLSPEQFADPAAIAVYFESESEKLSVSGPDALILLSRSMKAPWPLLGRLLSLVPRTSREWGYAAFARRRRRLRPLTCRIPDEKFWDRMLN